MKISLIIVSALGLSYLVFRLWDTTPLRQVGEATSGRQNPTHLEVQTEKPFFRKPQFGKKPTALGTKESRAADTATYVQDHVGRTRAVSRREVEAAIQNERDRLAQARADRLNHGLDVDAFKAEDKLREATRLLSPRMTVESVVAILGQPTKIEIPRERQFSPGVPIFDTLSVPNAPLRGGTNEFFLTYSPRKDIRSAVLPRDCVQVLYVRFDTNGMMRFWNWETPVVNVTFD